MNIDLIIIFKVVLTLYLVVALQLNQLHIFSCIAIISRIFAQFYNSKNEVLGSITNLSDCTLVKILLFGYQNYTQVENSYIINATIKYLVDSVRFNGPLLLLYTT